MKNNQKPTNLLHTKTITDRIGIARSTLWLWAKDGRFPRPIKLGPRTTVWRESDVEKWIAERAATSAV
jgi:prophage regulatory protein